MKSKYLKAGDYFVEATYRAHITIEEDQNVTEMELIDMVVTDPSCELVDWGFNG